MERSSILRYLKRANVPAAQTVAQRPDELKYHYSGGPRGWVHLGPQVTLHSYPRHFFPIRNCQKEIVCVSSQTIQLSAQLWRQCASQFTRVNVSQHISGLNQHALMRGTHTDFHFAIRLQGALAAQNFRFKSLLLFLSTNVLIAVQYRQRVRRQKLFQKHARHLMAQNSRRWQLSIGG